MFDGDNYHWISRYKGFILRKRAVVSMLKYAGSIRRPARIQFDRTVVFVSRHNLEGDLAPNQVAIKNVQRGTGIHYHVYPIVDGHGHDDGKILTYIHAVKKDFDVIVVVTSDADYFADLEELGQQGKLVVLLCFKGHTNHRELDRLRHVRYAWVDSLPTDGVPDSLFK